MLRLPRGLLSAAPAGADAPAGPLPDLTEGEIANGWTAEAVAEHRRQIEASAYSDLMERLFPAKPPLRVENVAGFDPHTW